MIDIKLVNKLYSDKTLNKLYQNNLIGQKIFLYRDIKNYVDRHIDFYNLSKNAAVLNAEKHFKTEERTIWRALKTFEK